MSQPKWKLIANIGDVSPFEHGGQFIFKDLTGKYPPELEIIEPMPDHITVDSKPCANVCRIVMEDLTKDTLCNEFWGDPEEIGAVAGFIGLDPDIFISYILGSDLVNRGVVWHGLYLYYGAHNLGGEDNNLKRISDLKRKYGRLKAIK